MVLVPSHIPRMALRYSRLSPLPRVMMFSGLPRILAFNILLLQLLTFLWLQLLITLHLQVLTTLKLSHPTSIPTLLPQFILLLLFPSPYLQSTTGHLGEFLARISTLPLPQGS